MNFKLEMIFFAILVVKHLEYLNTIYLNQDLNQTKAVGYSALK